MSSNELEPVSPSFHLDSAWKTAMDAAYHEVVIDYGNDGRLEDDQYLPQTEREAKERALESLARDTGVPLGFVRDRIDDNAYAHGYSPAHDETTNYLQAPDWSDMTDWYSSAAEYAERHHVADYGQEISGEAAGS